MLKVSNSNYLNNFQREIGQLIRWEADTCFEGLDIHLRLRNIQEKISHLRLRSCGKNGDSAYKNVKNIDGTMGLVHDVWDQFIYDHGNDPQPVPTFELITHWVKTDCGLFRGITEYNRIWSAQPACTVPSRHVDNSCSLATITRKKFINRILSSITDDQIGGARYIYIYAMVVGPTRECIYLDDGVPAHIPILADYYISLPFETYEQLLVGDVASWGSLPPAKDEKTQRIVSDVANRVLRRFMAAAGEQLG